MINKKSTSIVIIGAAFVDIKGYPFAQYIPGGRNSGHVVEVHGGVARNIAEDIANIELRPTMVTVLDNTALGEDVIRKLSKHLLRISRTSTRSRYQSLRKIQQSLVRQLRDFSRCVKLTRQSRTVL